MLTPKRKKLSRARSHDKLILAVALFFAVITMVAGGASRADSFGQLIVRVASTLTIAAILLQSQQPLRWASVRPAIIFLTAAVGLILVQLVPLPPALWALLPGRTPYLGAGALLGSDQPWRPINLTPDLGWNALLALLPAFAATTLMAALPPERRSLLLPVLIIAAMTSAVLGLAQISDGNGSPLRYYRITSEGSANGFFANRNHQATLLSLALPVVAAWGAIGLRAPSVDRGRIWIAATASILLVLMIPITGSRAGLATGLVGVAFALYFFIGQIAGARDVIRRKKRKAVIAGLAIAALALVGVATTITRAQAIQRLYSTDVASETRYRVGGTLIGMAETFFPVGAGFGSFNAAYRRFEKLDTLSDNYLNEAHNDFLQIVIEGGIAGALLVVAYIVWWLRRSIDIWRNASFEDADKTMRVSFVITLIVLLASIVDYPLRTPLMSVIFTIASIGMIGSGKSLQLGDDTQGR